MWQRFTERARRVVQQAQHEAARLGMSEIRPEHFLLAILREEESVAAALLARLDVPLGELRREVEQGLETGTRSEGEEQSLAPATKWVIDRAYDEARALNCNYIGTEHLLLALAREPLVPGARAPGLFGLTHDALRDELQRMREGEFSSEAAAREAARLLETLLQPIHEPLVFAAEEAARLGRHEVGTEHLLLALLRGPESRGRRLLERLGTDLVELRALLEARAAAPEAPGTALTYSPAVERALRFAIKEFGRGEGDRLAEEHLLLGLLAEGEGTAALVLGKLGVRLERARQEAGRLGEGAG